MGDTSRQIPQSNNLMLAFFLLLVAAVVHGDEIVCGEPEISPKLPGQKILNGEEATPHSFPWQVSITGALDYDADHYCGASILSPSWVLTAAQPWKLRRGELPLISDEECAQIYLEG